ncbi:hypothetical protein KO481_23325 [Nocardia sp. NEAU-G5]|uniref:Uncharacterized protein n=1 Tax=Nocardia albiluteola TaxID=2842303 RepID=A0ABS6B2D6_9NOCA|nr:hypothetical protein [Nocardia albiluteola]MBU3064452.1 hypothetical protein [Nocardia albiluteola]
MDAVDSGARRPTAVGLIRAETPVPAATRHALALPRHARSLGYRYAYTVVRHEALFSGSEVRGL